MQFFFSDETADDLASATSYSCPAGGAATPAGSGRHRPHITVMTTGKSGGKVSSLAARWRVPGRSRQGSHSECAIAAGGQTGSCISHHEITYVPTSALKEIDQSDRKHEVSSNTDMCTTKKISRKFDGTLNPLMEFQFKMFLLHMK